MVKKQNNNTSLLFKMSLREIKNNFKQYIALILISFLAVTLFIGLTANSRMLQSRVDMLYDQGNIADLFVYVDKTSLDDENYLISLDGVDKVEKRLSCTAVADGKSATFMIGSKDNLISQYASIDEPGERGMLFDEHYGLTSLKEVGSKVDFELPISPRDITDMYLESQYPSSYQAVKEYLNSLVKEGYENPLESTSLPLTYKITGYMFHPETAEMSSSTALKILMDDDVLLSLIQDKLITEIEESFRDSTLFGVNIKETLITAIRSFAISDYYNQFLIKVNDVSKIKEVQKSINDYFSSSSSTSKLIATLSKDTLPSTLTIEADVKQAEQLTLVFPAIFFIVAILVVLTSLSQLIYRSRSDIGTMKALGIPRSKILFHYIWIGVLLSLIGCVLGSIVGPLLIPGVMNRKYNILYSLPTIGAIFPLDRIILCTLIFCILSGLVSFLVSRGEVNLSPIESMRPKVMKSLKELKSKNEKKRSPIQLSMRMALRNIIAKWSRTFMVIFGVMGCTALLVSGFGIMDTVNYGVNLDFEGHMKSSISLSYGNHGNEEELISKIEGVDSYNPYMTLPLQAVSETSAIDTTLTVFEHNDTKSYDFASSIDDGIVLSSYTAEKLGVEVGDFISIIYLGERYDLSIDALFPSSYLLRLYTTAENIKVPFSASGADITLLEGYSPDNIKQEIENLNLDLASLNTNEELSIRIKEILGSVEVMCNTVKVFAILLAIVVTYNLALLNFNERRRDVATLKVIGCKPLEIVLSLVGEILILTILGVLLGLLLGYPLLVTILQVNQTEMFHFLYHIFPATYLYSVLISFGAAIIVNIMLGRLANKVDAVSALKSVE